MCVETKESKKLSRSVVPIGTMNVSSNLKDEVNMIQLWQASPHSSVGRALYLKTRVRGFDFQAC